MDLQEYDVKLSLDSTGSVYGQLTSCCEHGNELSNKRREVSRLVERLSTPHEGLYPGVVGW
jgi:hypothetical protein